MLTNRIVMVVDDDEDDREFFKDALHDSKIGASCIEASNGVAALEILESLVTLPDVIFVDINMPKMDGKKFIEIAKADPRLKNIPFIVLSTSALFKDINDCYRLGVKAYIRKEPSAAKLALSISKALAEVDMVG